MNNAGFSNRKCYFTRVLVGHGSVVPPKKVAEFFESRTILVCHSWVHWKYDLLVSTDGGVHHMLICAERNPWEMQGKTAAVSTR